MTERVKELPSWFKLENYDQYASYEGSKLFIEELSKRSRILGYLKSPSMKIRRKFYSQGKPLTELISTNMFTENEQLLLSLLTIEENRLLPEHEYEPIKPNPLIFTEEIRKIIGRQPLPRGHVVRPLSVLDVVKYQKIIDQDPEGFSQINLDTFDSLTEQEQNDLRASLDSHRHLDFQKQINKSVTLTITLESVSDDMILEEIALLLPEYRKAIGLNPSKKDPSEKDYKKMNTKKYTLPILDLLIWQVMYNKKISAKTVVELLDPFGEGELTESTLGKHIDFIEKKINVQYFHIPNT